MQYEDPFGFVAIKDTARRFNNLSITPPFEFFGFRAAFRMLLQLIDVFEYALHQSLGRFRVIECHVVGDGIQIG